MSRHFLLELLEKGEARLTDEGYILILGEFGFLLPMRVFLQLNDMLKEKFNDKGKFMYDLGKFQVEEAIKRYKKALGIQKLDRMKIVDLFLQPTQLMGLGNLELKNANYEKGEGTYVMSKNAMATLYLQTKGKAKKPIDYYLCGVIAGGFKTLCGKRTECMETKCVACGDPFCQFEVGPKIKPPK